MQQFQSRLWEELRILEGFNYHWEQCVYFVTDMLLTRTIAMRQIGRTKTDESPLHEQNLSNSIFIFHLTVPLVQHSYSICSSLRLHVHRQYLSIFPGLFVTAAPGHAGKAAAGDRQIWRIRMAGYYKRGKTREGVMGGVGDDAIDNSSANEHLTYEWIGNFRLSFRAHLPCLSFLSLYEDDFRSNSPIFIRFFKSK